MNLQLRAPEKEGIQETWRWPLQVDAYDKAPQLTQVEYATLEKLFARSEGHIYPSTKRPLQRIVQPIEDALLHIHAIPVVCRETLRLMLLEMYHRGTTFWGWSVEEWEECFCDSRHSFAQRYGRLNKRSYARRHLPVLAYLLRVQPQVERFIEMIEIVPLAYDVFGQELVEQAIQPLFALLQGWGYSLKERQNPAACLAYLLLRNESPFLSHLSLELLVEVSQTCQLPCVQQSLFRISRALCGLGIIEHPLPEARVVPPQWRGSTADIAPEWLSWVERWRKHSTLQSTEHTYYQLLKVGRWLTSCHPEVGSPADMTPEIAAEFVAAVNGMKIGEWTQVHHPSDRLGQPLLPRAKNGLLGALRYFLRDCQEWDWIPIRFNPLRVLRTPLSILHRIGPNPRVIDKSLWAKLLWAAMNLEYEDLPQSKDKKSVYPLELVRAIAVVWCFAALRNNEIRRLRVGCVRWQYEDVMVPETGEILPKDATCFLDIPVNKTSTAYTKPVHPLVGKRINEWERIRPKEQFREIDAKTGEPVPFLFSYRGKRIWDGYINETLIPLLCRKAGIPEQDSRGQITSHRARATIASMLYNAKEPLSIFELKEYLGHKHLSSTQSYLLVDPTKLASKVVKAGYLEQNLATIEVLLDQEAVMSGAASRGERWKYYDLGHGWCTNPFWASCAHRMACAKCPYYQPKESLADQLVEGKANLVRMLEFVQLTEDEKLLVTEGIELHQELIEKLVDVPTPAGPTPRELDTRRQGEMKAIPLKNVQRKRRKQHEP
jgi:integrase